MLESGLRKERAEESCFGNRIVSGDVSFLP
jgi:hypothetical protein